MITPEESMIFIQPWGALPGFPHTDSGVEGLAAAFSRIAADYEKAQWISDQVMDGCSRCPTPIEIRRIYSKKYPPADGKSTSDCDNYDLMDTGRKM